MFTLVNVGGSGLGPTVVDVIDPRGLWPRVLPSVRDHRGWVLSGALLGAVAAMQLHPAFVLTVPVWAFLMGRWDTTALRFSIVLVTALALSPVVLRITWWDPRVWAGITAAAVLLSLLPWLIGRHVRDRRALQRSETELMETVAERQRDLAGQARLRERARLAREMHDTLGHQLSLIALQAGALEVGAVSQSDRSQEAARLRAATTRAAEQLNDIVGLLSEGSGPAPLQPPPGDLADVVRHAAEAGVDVSLASTDCEWNLLPTVVRHVAARVVQEGLTNAVKHSPGAAVAVHVTRSADEVVVRVVNPRPVRPGDPVSGGRGLATLTERVEYLGGTLRAETVADGFALAAHLPLVAPQIGDDIIDELATSALPRAELAAGRREMQRSLLWVVVGPLIALLLIAVGFSSYFTYVTIASVLTEEEFAQIEVGDSRAQTERILPPVEMLEPPTDRVRAPQDSGEECFYYEGEVSFFDRAEVYRVCFADGKVTSADVVPPEAP